MPVATDRLTGRGARTRNASVLLLALVLAGVASMVAYGFALAMRRANASASLTTSQALAKSAALSGLRHAMEVVTADYIAAPTGITSQVGPHFSHFCPTYQWDAARMANGDELAALTDADNLSSEANLTYMHATWYGDQDEGQAYSSAGPAWPASTRTSSICNTGLGRYLEPGRYNSNGSVIRFSDPSTTPSVNTPIYFDAAFKPVTAPNKVRYRLRYALNCLDLGGHLVWGRQTGFAAANPLETAPIGTANAAEWDGGSAREWNRSFFNMVSSQGISQKNYKGEYLKPPLQTLFLGYGAGLKTDSPGELLTGFEASGNPTPFNSIPGVVVLDSFSLGGNLDICARGGPVSWKSARDNLGNLKVDGQWLSNWIMSPYGRAGEHADPPSSNWQYWQGPTSCPWRVNALTAPAQVIRYMVWGYQHPVALKATATKESWPDLATPEWQATQVAGFPKTYNPPVAGSARGPGFELQVDAFSPSYLGGIKPFAGFISADYRLATTATAFNLSYPGPPVDWEDYAPWEMSTVDKVFDRAEPSDPELDTTMLGSRIDVYDTRNRVDTTKPYSPTTNSVGALSADSKRFPEPSGPKISCRPFETLRGTSGPMNFPYEWNADTRIEGGLKRDITIDSAQGFFHRDSYLQDVASALCGTLVMAKSLYQDDAALGSFATIKDPTLPPAVSLTLTKPTHVRDLDRFMLATLGEYFGCGNAAYNDATAPGSTLTSKPHAVAGRDGVWWEPSSANKVMRIVPYTCSANIMNVGELIKANVADGTKLKRKLINMERVLNDWRMSFFGANPTYTDFRPLDFDRDGWAVASCYTGSHPTMHPSAGNPNYPAGQAINGIGPAPDCHFSLTGYFTLEKARYYRVLVRGELFDELTQKAVAETNMDAAFCIDPNGDYTGTAGSLDDSCTLYSRWMTNNYRGLAQMAQ